MASSAAALGSSSAHILPRTLTLVETLGFGLTGLLLWIGVAPGVHAELGMQAMWVWIPGAILGMVVNFQVRQLGQQMPDVAGGTPNYLTHLLPDVPWLTRYAAIGYFLSWVAVLPVNAIILTELIQASLVPLGIVIPGMSLKVGFVLLAFVVAFSGSRALSTLHLVFLVPAVGLLLVFCLQGNVWLLATDQNKWTALASGGSGFSFQGWAKWYLNGTYAFYACETASAFVADSKQPQKALQSLLVVAGLIPIVYIAGSWLLLHLPYDSAGSQDAFSTLLVAAGPWWGTATPLLITFLVMSSCLLSLATAVSIAPRVLYQLAQDQQISPLYSWVSPQGVFTPGLGLSLLLSLGCLVWGDLHQIVMVTGVGWLVAFIVLHGGLWYQRGQQGGLLPWLALAMAILELFVLGVGGWAWGTENLAIGLLLPLVIVLAIQHRDDSATKGKILSAENQLIWGWLQRLFARQDEQRGADSQDAFGNLVTVQIAILVGFISTAAVIGWQSHALIARADASATVSVDFLVVLVLVLSFFGVAIACWTIFPQIEAVNNARQSAEDLSQQLRAAFKRLQQTQVQMVQQEKLSSLGQLVAGIAHEINNPVSFIHGNLTHAQAYVNDLLALVHLYETHYPHPTDEIQAMTDEIDLEFISEDLPKLLSSMTVGTDRICEIVLSLRNFSRKDESACKAVDIHEGLESTLLILQHRLKATSKGPQTIVVRDYGQLPLVECYPSQLNQVFMNILANALDAMAETNAGQGYEEIAASPDQITIRTGVVDQRWIEIAIADNGPGIPDAVKSRIFDPFFTTKPVGKGTGLGMSISYQIITQRHQGKLECASKPNRGTEFTIQIPLQQ